MPARDRVVKPLAYIEAEMHDVAFPYDVLLSFKAQAPGFACAGEHRERHFVVVGGDGCHTASDPLLDHRRVARVRTDLAHERLLGSDGLLLRYRNDDDFGETTSAFTICSFWWAEALALAG